MMKKSLLISGSILFLSCFLACASSPDAKTTSNSSTSQTPAAESPKKSDNVVFAESLQNALENNDLNGALSLFDSLPASLEQDVDIKILQASLLISAGKTTEASEIANKLLAENPDNQDVVGLAAELAIATGNKQTQSNLVKQLLAADRFNPTANIILGNQQALKKQYKLALGYYRNALVREPNNLDALFGFAQMSYYRNDIETSRNSFLKILQLDPDNATAYSYLGKLAAEDENYKKAIEYVEKAISLDDKNYDFYIDLGQYKRNIGQYSDAEKSWTKAISINPGYFLAYTYRAGIYDEQNKIKEALTDYHKIIETNPKYHFAWEEIGILEFHEKNWAGARDAFLRANNIHNQTAYQLMVITTYLKEKNVLEAKKYAELCMKPLDHNSLDYKIIRLFHDQGPVNSENAIMNELEKETDKTKKGKMMYYFGMYFELKGSDTIAKEYYGKITKLQSPMFFEYRLAEWSMLGNE